MKKLLVVLLALALVFAMAACGGSEEPAADGDFTTATEGVLIMATNAAFPP
ncbi:MAG: hypothetical protein J6T26_08365 [Firmicutes bacterium]|nr:hypothetical protein [Bacillota bacterium]